MLFDKAIKCFPIETHGTFKAIDFTDADPPAAVVAVESDARFHDANVGFRTFITADHLSILHYEFCIMNCIVFLLHAVSPSQADRFPEHPDLLSGNSRAEPGKP